MDKPVYEVRHGDALNLLKQARENSASALVTDPPAGISFMSNNVDWDCFRRKNNPADVGREDVFGRISAHAPYSYGESDRGRFVAYLTPIFQEALRVVKPGGFGLIWALPRTAHWTAWALEDAGWEIRGKFYAHFGTGFPKNQDISLQMDKKAGVERDVIAVEDRRSDYDGRERNSVAINTNWRRSEGRSDERDVSTRLVTSPVTEDARQWEGHGTAIKPATEEWLLVRKPTNLTYVDNIKKWGCGSLNIDASRVYRAGDDVPGWHKTGASGSDGFRSSDTFRIHDMSAEEVQARCGSKGRYPADLLLNHSEECRLVGTQRVPGSKTSVIPPSTGTGEERGKRRIEGHVIQGHADEDGKEEVEVWECHESCPVRLLNEQSGISRSPKKTIQGGKAGGGFDPGSSDGTRHREVPGYKDMGGASRFFTTFHYCPKSSKAERESGLLGYITCVYCGGLDTKTHVHTKSGKTVPCLRNSHPTVKSLSLMQYLVRLVTPPGGVCLDCFLGSGTTGVAAILEGFQFVGIEQELRSYQIAKRRIEYALEKRGNS